MIKVILLLFGLVTLAVSIDDQVKHLMINQANLIETMQGFALNAPILEQNNIKTVSVNGDNVVITAPDCQQTQLTKQQLASAPDYQNILSSAKLQLKSAESNQPQRMTQYNSVIRSGVARYSLNGQTMATMSYGRNMNFQSFSSNGWAMTKYDDNNMSMKGPNMPDNMSRIFISNDVVTFVYNTGGLIMKPQACLQPAEQQLVQQVRAQLQHAQGHFNQNMRQFQQNMQNMRQNMQQNMQNMQMRMQQNMQNMFGGRHYNPINRFSSQNQQQQSLDSGLMGQYQVLGENGQEFPAASSASYPAAAAFASAAPGANAFGTNFPFGPNNSPFWQGFPFSG